MLVSAVIVRVLLGSDLTVDAAIDMACRICIIKACPHRFPKHDTLYLETRHFVAASGNKVTSLTCFRIQVCHSDNEVA